MVPEENAQATVDCKNNERKDDGDGGGKKRVAECSKEEPAEVFGHLLRHECLGKEVFLGKIEGRKARGRQRITFGASLVDDVPAKCNGGRTGADGARSRGVSFHGRPSQSRQGTSVR